MVFGKENFKLTSEELYQCYLPESLIGDLDRSLERIKGGIGGVREERGGDCGIREERGGDWTIGGGECGIREVREEKGGEWCEGYSASDNP